MTRPPRSIVVVLLGALALVLPPGCTAEEEPETSIWTPIEWGDAACAYCEMPVADRAFAARCLDPAGVQHAFDDVGCLVIEVGMGRIDAREMQFRHSKEDRWLEPEEVAFLRHEETPMRFGFAAVEAGKGELSLQDVWGELTERFEIGPR